MEESQAPFHKVAPFYNRLMKGMPYSMWIGYYYLLLSVVQSHPKSVLEVGCGTGTLCGLLEKEGLEVTGVDLSADMIQVAQETFPYSSIHFHVGDARTFELNRTYDSALSFFDSLNNLTSQYDLFCAFERVAAHLAPGGSFVFDLNTPYAFEQRMFDQHFMTQTARLRYHWQGDYEPETKIIKVKMDFWWEGEKFTELHTQRAYEPDEVMELLERAGFCSINAYHSYGLTPPRKSSDRVHYVCLKK